MTTPCQDLRANLGYRRNPSAYASHLVSVHGAETRDIRALGWCPGESVIRLEICLLVFYEQLQGILSIWDLLQYNFCMLLEMSGKDLN